VVKKHLAKNNVTALEHPPYSPDFFLFPCPKSVLKGQQVVSTEEITVNVMIALAKVLKNGFQECFQKLYECW
jgi:hypothetical protein